MRKHKVAVLAVVMLFPVMFLVNCQLDRPTDSGQAQVGPNNVLGLLTNAADGQPLVGAMVTVDGPVTRSVNTDAAGQYAVNQLPHGTYRTTATTAGFIPLTKVVALQDTTLSVNFVLSEGLSENAYRFVLSWDVDPADLDAHLWSGTSHIYYASTGAAASEPFIYLDVDDVSSYGPETITVSQLDNTCVFAIHNFSNDAAITVSRAHIDIYQGSTRIAYYDAPTSGSGRWWYVCDLNANGSILTRNTLSDDAPTSSPPALAPKGQ